MGVSWMRDVRVRRGRAQRHEAMPGCSAPALPLRRRLRASIERLARRPSTEQRVAQRARIVLLAHEGLSNAAIATVEGVCEATARKWRERMRARPHVKTLEDAPLSGR